MHRWVRRALCAAGLAGGTVLLGIGLAEAASADANNGPVTTGESGILSGNQTGVGIQAPVNASGNQLTVIGQDNHATSAGAASTPAASTSSGGSPTTSGLHGIGSGNQTAVHALAPVNVSGNQVTIIGQRNTTTATGGAAAPQRSSGSPTTTGQSGIGSGNQTGVTALVPVNVSGNQVTVIGQDNTVSSLGGSTTGGSTTGGSGTGTTSSGSPTTSGQGGIGSGNQTGIDVLAPIAATGNQVTVIGQDNTVSSLGGSTTGGSGTGTTSSGSPTTSGQDGILSGNQTALGALVPVNVSGNQVTVIGQHNTVSSLGGSTTGSGTTSSGSPTTSGQGGIGSGNQTGIDVLAPIAATGNQATVIGQDNTVTSTGGSSTGGTPTGGGTGGTGSTTTGAGGVGSGNQTPISVQVPVDVSGNQVTVIGQDNTVTSTGGSSTGGTPGGTTGGGTTSPPGGVVVSPPTSGGASSTSQAASAPVTGTLPSTGMSGNLPGLALLAALLLLLGSALTRREVRAATQE